MCRNDILNHPNAPCSNRWFVGCSVQWEVSIYRWAIKRLHLESIPWLLRRNSEMMRSKCMWSKHDENPRKSTLVSRKGKHLESYFTGFSGSAAETEISAPKTITANNRLGICYIMIEWDSRSIGRQSDGAWLELVLRGSVLWLGQNPAEGNQVKLKRLNGRWCVEA